MRSKKLTTDPTLLHYISHGLSTNSEQALRIALIIKSSNEPTSGERIRNTDEVEALFVEELRQLGNESLEGWSKGANNRPSKELKEEDPTARVRAKTLEWWARFGLLRSKEALWCGMKSC